MKNTIKWFGIIAFIAVIGFSFVACGDDDGDKSGNDAFAGTWTSTDAGLKLIASNGSFKEYTLSDNKEVIRGTYTVSGNTVTAKIVEINPIFLGGTEGWVTYANLDATQKGYVGTETQQLTITDNTFIGNGMTFTK